MNTLSNSEQNPWFKNAFYSEVLLKILRKSNKKRWTILSWKRNWEKLTFIFISLVSSVSSTSSIVPLLHRNSLALIRAFIGVRWGNKNTLLKDVKLSSPQIRFVKAEVENPWRKSCKKGKNKENHQYLDAKFSNWFQLYLHDIFWQSVPINIKIEIILTKYLI